MEMEKSMMEDESWKTYNTDFIVALNDNVNWQQKENWVSFAAVVVFSISIGLISELGDGFQESDFASIIRDAQNENGIFVGQKGKELIAMIFGEKGAVIAQYNANSKTGTYRIIGDLVSQGKMTIFIVGDFKERKIIDSFVHVDANSYANEYEAIAKAFIQNGEKPDPSQIPPPNSSYWVESGDYEGYIRSRVAWGEGYINDDGEFIEFD